jgi:gluconate 2-dehydrogenase gamma chain
VRVSAGSVPASRRVFLQTVVHAGLGGYLAIATGACHRGPLLRARRKSGHEFFTPAEFETVAAACERIFPHDDEDPGAIELGVPIYIDRALAHDDYLHWSNRFRQGVQDLDDEAQNQLKNRFHRLEASDQDDILEDWESGSPVQHEFFRMLVHLTLEGAFGDPSYGGNRGGLGWRLIGFAPDAPMPGMHH